MGVGYGGLKLLKTSSHPSCPLGLCVGGKKTVEQICIPPQGILIRIFSLSFFSLPFFLRGWALDALPVGEQARGSLWGSWFCTPPLHPPGHPVCPLPASSSPPLWASFVGPVLSLSSPTLGPVQMPCIQHCCLARGTLDSPHPALVMWHLKLLWGQGSSCLRV